MPSYSLVLCDSRRRIDLVTNCNDRLSSLFDFFAHFKYRAKFLLSVIALSMKRHSPVNAGQSAVSGDICAGVSSKQGVSTGFTLTTPALPGTTPYVTNKRASEHRDAARGTRRHSHCSLPSLPSTRCHSTPQFPTAKNNHVSEVRIADSISSGSTRVWEMSSCDVEMSIS